MKIVAIAALAATLSAVGDYLCVLAARGVWPRTNLLVGSVLWAILAPMFFWMSKITGGSFVAACTAWSIISALLSIILAIVLEESQNRAEWVGFALIVLGALVRHVAK